MIILYSLFFRSGLVLLAALAPVFVYAIGEAGETAWPEGAKVEVGLKLTARLDDAGRPRIAGDLMITNPTDSALTIQKPTNRLVLAFFVSDGLGNPVAPEGLSKVDPSFETLSLAPHATYTHHFQGLEYVTGSIQKSYALTPGMSYRIIAVYRAAGPRGPGFTSRETELKIPE